MESQAGIPPEVQRKFEVFDWRNGLAILKSVHPDEWQDLAQVLSEFALWWTRLAEKGKNKTETAKLLDTSLDERGWIEKAFATRIVVDAAETPSPTHSVDCYKNKVALDVEWNNKDPFLDRDLAEPVVAPSPYSASSQRRTAMTGRPDSVAKKLSESLHGKTFATVLADPPWQFINRTGKVAPEHRRLSRYRTMTTDEICRLPVSKFVREPAHLYLWVPNALLPDGLRVMNAWGFQYKANIVWHKIRKDGGSDGRGVGFYFRNVTELLLFGVRGKNGRTLAPGRRQVNYIAARKREHSRKPDEQYHLIEACSPGPYLELFARGTRPRWSYWGDQADDSYEPSWATYAFNSRDEKKLRARSGRQKQARSTFELSAD